MEYISPGGAVHTFPDDVTPEELNEIADQIDREERVSYGSQNRLMAETGGERPSALRAGLAEFGRNFAFGIPENLEGAGVLSQGDFGTGDLAPRDFYETRDASRAAQDLYTRQSGLPSWLDNALSLTGVLTAPGPKGSGGAGSVLGRMANVAGKSAAVGAPAGALEGNAQDLEGMLREALLGGIIGAGVGGGVQGVGEGVSGAVRGVYGGADSGHAFDVQSQAGMRPTVGSVGNAKAAMAENTLIDYPFSLNRMIPGVPDTASVRGQNQDVLQGQYGQSLESMSPGYEPRALGQYNQDTRASIDATTDQLRTDRRTLSEDMLTKIPSDTPVRTTPVEEFPQNLRDQNRDVNLAGRAQADVDRLMANPATVVDDPMYRALSAQYNDLTTQRTSILGNIEQMEAQRAEFLNNPSQYPNGARRADRLQTNIRGAKAQLDRIDTSIADTQRRVRDNRTRTFGAVKDWRSGIGNQAQGTEGLAKFEKDELYEAVTRQLEEAGGPDFKQINDQIRGKYADNKVISEYFGGQASSTFSKLNRAFTKGDANVLDTLAKTMDEGDWAKARAGLLDEMSRDTKGNVNLQKFWKSYGSMSPDMQTRLAGSPESKALLDALSEVTETLDPSVVNRNFSGTASSGGLLGTIAVGPKSAAQFMVRLGIVDAAMASDMMARAVAGKDTSQLMKVLKKWAVTEGTRGDPDERPGAETVKEVVE